MRLRLLALLCVALATAAPEVVEGVVQSKPDFSGHWVLTSARPARPGYEPFWLGTEARVTQSAGTLEIARAAPLPQRNARFNLDGTEGRNVYVVQGQRQERDSRATWNDNALLISTDTTTEDGRRWLSSIMRWSFDADGTLLVVDTEICGTGNCPSVVTNLTFKKKQ